MNWKKSPGWTTHLEGIRVWAYSDDDGRIHATGAAAGRTYVTGGWTSRDAAAHDLLRLLAGAQRPTMGQDA